MSNGDLYRDFQGGIYKFITRATNTETLEDMVVYQSIETGEFWVRPASMFFEYMDNDQHKGFRFTPIDHQ